MSTPEPDTDTITCTECTLPVGTDCVFDEDDRPFHWSCRVEFYERERLADGGDA